MRSNFWDPYYRYISKMNEWNTSTFHLSNARILKMYLGTSFAKNYLPVNHINKNIWSLSFFEDLNKVTKNIWRQNLLAICHQVVNSHSRQINIGGFDRKQIGKGMKNVDFPRLLAPPFHLKVFLSPFRTEISTLILGAKKKIKKLFNMMIRFNSVITYNWDEFTLTVLLDPVFPVSCVINRHPQVSLPIFLIFCFLRLFHVREIKTHLKRVF